MRDFKSWSNLAWASSLGITLVISTFLGLALGIFLDGKLNTSPYLTIFFLLLGIIAGFLNIFKERKKREYNIRDCNRYFNRYI